MTMPIRSTAVALAVLLAALAVGAEPSNTPATAAAAPLRWTVVERYPHDPRAFTQGLLVDGGTLYESTGLRGQSTVRVVDLTTGQVRRKVDLPPDLFGEGLAKVGDRLVQLTWTEGRARVYNLPDLSVAAEHRYEGQGWGLCFDGSRLVMSDGSHRLFFRDPESFALVGSVEVFDGGRPVHHLNELECVRDRVYANVWGTWHIVRIDPASGRVDGRMDATGLLSLMEQESLPDGAVLNGIAHDPVDDTFLLTGKLWPRVHRVRILDAQ